MADSHSLAHRFTLACPVRAVAGPGGLLMPPRPEAADEQRIDDLIAHHLAAHKLEVLKQAELVRALLCMHLPCLPIFLS